MGTDIDRLSTRIAAAFARFIMVIMAAGIAYTGYSLLTTPWAIPLTVGLWLGGVAIAALGIFGHLPHDGEATAARVR